ncbi:11862_t:CDS:2, partial [Acaulospora morrowiae]
LHLEMPEETSKRASKHPWTPQEDELLKNKIKEHGTSWAKIATYFNDRDAQSCKNRHQYLKRRPADWSEEEDLSLKQAMKDHGKLFAEAWKAVADDVPNKTWQ